MLSLSFGGFERKFVLRVPPAEPPATGWPVVVVLHGMGGTADWTLAETGWDRFADANGIVLIVPEALPSDPSKPVSFWKNPTAWNDGHPDRSNDVDDVGFLDAVMAEAHKRVHINRRRVFATGFSNGAAMTFRLAVERPNVLAAIAPVAGYCRVNVPSPIRPVPTFYLVGDRDPFLPIQGGVVKTVWGWSETRPPIVEMFADWSAALGGSRTPELTTDVDGLRLTHYAHPTVAIRCGVIEELGHHWPGGRGQLSRRLFGPPCHRIDANRLIWAFFAEAPK